MDFSSTLHPLAARELPPHVNIKGTIGDRKIFYYISVSLLALVTRVSPIKFLSFYICWYSKCDPCIVFNLPQCPALYWGPLVSMWGQALELAALERVGLSVARLSRGGALNKSSHQPQCGVHPLCLHWLHVVYGSLREGSTHQIPTKFAHSKELNVTELFSGENSPIYQWTLSEALYV